MIIDIPVSIGEVFDKITILSIKSEKVSEKSKLDLIKKELLLLEASSAHAKTCSTVSDLVAALRSTNYCLWQIEDKIREQEKKGSFGEEFVALARLVYMVNDIRADIKNRINLALQSEFSEVKSYTPYGEKEEIRRQIRELLNISGITWKLE